MKLILLFFSLSLLIKDVKAQIDLQNGLLTHYTFSGNSNDASASLNHGTVYGATLTTDRFGNANSAYSFDGVNDYIDFSTSNLLNNSYSYSFWVKATTIPGNGGYTYMLSIGGTGGDQSFDIVNNANGATGWTVGGYNTGGNPVVSFVAVGTLPTPNTWYHCVMTRDNTAMKLYVDGVFIGSSSTGGLPPNFGSSTKGVIGARCTVSQFFNGVIDDVRIYNRVLSNNEIMELYSESISSSKDGSNLITGKVFNDLNKNCIQEIAERGIPGRIVKAEPGPAYGYTDSNGVYKLFVNNGSFTVRAISPEWWKSSCNDSTETVSFTIDSSISFSNNFGSAVIPFQRLTVDIATPLLRRCFRNTYNVSYCNDGTADASNVEVKIEFPPSIIPLNSTKTWTKNGNLYSFNLGTVNAGTCGSFRITDSVSCDVPLGSSHCVKATIASPSVPPTNGTDAWDKSSVKVEGQCILDSVAQFTITNTGEPGNGDMDAPSQFRIYADNELVHTGQFQLIGGQTQTIKVDALGMTIRLEADQRPGHPGKSRPRETIEGCGEGNGGAISLGFRTQVPEDDEDFFVEEDCQVIIGSFDPNDKNVKPTGLTENHYIRDDQELEYLIRFQNTGTDTAFTVVIRDTLSSFLDVTTVKSGASSHPYNLRISGNGQAVLEWTFPNILLPDENKNEPGSHGFVKFKVKQKTGNPKWTLIENRAGIIFDYNEPVITNYAQNIVHDIIIQGAPMPLLSVKSKTYTNNVQIKVEPNPFKESAYIRIESQENWDNMTLDVYDLSGKLILSVPTNTKDFYLHKNNLSGGFYLFKVRSDGEMLGSGKLIVE